MTSILVTGAGGGLGQGIIKALRCIPDMKLQIIASDVDSRSPGLYWADRAVLLPAASASDYVDLLTELCAHECVDFYIPGTDSELSLCAQIAGQLRRTTGTEIVISPPDVVAIADDKYRTFQFLEEHDLPRPKTFIGSEVDPDKIGYPIIVKPRRGWRSIGVTLARNKSELSARLSQEPNLLVQEHIGSTDDEYTCTIVTVRGECSDVVVFRRWLRSGDTYRAIPVQNKTIEQYVMRVTSLLGVEGPANFQIRLDNDVPKLFEINSRFSGTTPLCAIVGMNPVEFFLKRRLGLPFISKLRYDIVLMRYWSEEIALLSSTAELERIALSKASR
jgi:carbamoyl-phosphate synthase large subunit